MSSYYVKSEYGTFRVTINDDKIINIQTRTETKIGIQISVGGNNKCVFINIPDNSDTAHLLNLKTKDGGCEVHNKLITGKGTIGMVNLAFTLVKKEAPHIKRVKLEDESDFTCTLSNGKTVGISMTVYEEYKHGFQEKLPNTFSFHNKDLNELLTPIYLQSTTWRDFFDTLHALPNVCQVIYPWYKYAIRDIFKNFPVERNNWMIELYNNPNVETVNYNVVEKNIKGGRRKTRKNDDSIYKYSFYHLVDSIERPFYDDIYNLKYK